VRIPLLLLPLLLTACSASIPEPRPLAESRPNCYQLPPAEWGACLERARAMDFNVYECERRALFGRPLSGPMTTPAPVSREEKP